MSKPMAQNLIKGGHSLRVHSRSRGPVDELVAAGAKAADSPADVASRVLEVHGERMLTGNYVRGSGPSCVKRICASPTNSRRRMRSRFRQQPC